MKLYGLKVYLIWTTQKPSSSVVTVVANTASREHRVATPVLCVLLNTVVQWIKLILRQNINKLNHAFVIILYFIISDYGLWKNSFKKQQIIRY
jgi:hypothetical protein